MTEKIKGSDIMEENRFWLKNEGVRIIHQLEGLIQWSDMGRSDEHKTHIFKKLMEIELRLKKL